MTQRNADIVARYADGAKPKAIASEFRLGRQQVTNLLKRAGVFQPYVKSNRTKFLGVNVSESTHGALKKKAAAAGMSTSRMVSDVLDGVVK